MEDSNAVLAQECKDIWNEMKSVQADLERLYIPKEQFSGLESQKIKVQLAKEKRLKAELNIVKNKVPQGLPDDPTVQDEVLYRGLKKSISQLRETVYIINSQKQQLQDDIAREREFQCRLDQIKESLLKALEATAVAESLTEKKFIQELVEKLARVENLNSWFQKHLKSFADKNFPLPKEPKTIVQYYGSNVNDHQLVPLSTILQSLLEQCLNHPDDPYIKTDNHFSQVFTELMIRCRIAEKHPNKDHLIRMVPFHM